MPDLPEEIALAMADIAGAAREGLLAMSVVAGMAVMAAMFEAEITKACGPKGKHNPERAAVLFAQVVMGRMLAAVATRQHARTAEPVGEAAGTQKSTSKSAISRWFVRQTETALGELMARDLAGEDIKVLVIDGEHMGERCVVVALAIAADGTKKPVRLRDSSTEDKTVVRALLAERA